MFADGMYRDSFDAAGNDKVTNETRTDYIRSIPLIFFVSTRILSLSVLPVQFFHLQIDHV